MANNTLNLMGKMLPHFPRRLALCYILKQHHGTVFPLAKYEVRAKAQDETDG
jgi:hypothetical protein